MNGELESVFKLQRFSTARMIFALGSVAAAIEKRGDDELARIAEHVGEALEHARGVRDLEMRHAASECLKRESRCMAAEIDAKIDRALAAFRGVVKIYADADTGDDGVTQATARRLLREVSTRERMLERIESGDMQGVRVLGLDYLIVRITKLRAEYRAARVDEEELVGFDEVLAAMKRAREMLLEVVALIVGQYPLETWEHRAIRAHLLGEVLRQNEAIAKESKSRRGGAGKMDRETVEIVEVIEVGAPERKEEETPAAE